MDGDSSFDGEVQFKLQGPDGRTETTCLTLGTGGSDSGFFQVGQTSVEIHLQLLHWHGEFERIRLI
jgi:hypothetical protein